MEQTKKKTTFDDRLGKQAVSEYGEMMQKIGDATFKVLEEYGLKKISRLDFALSRTHFNSLGYVNSARVVNSEQVQGLKQEIELGLMADFQQTLKDFSWAVDNQMVQQ